MEDELIRFEDAGNYRGNLEAKHEGGAYFWRVDCDVDEEEWSPIPEYLFDALKRHHRVQKSGEADLHEMVRWAYSKLHRQNYSQQADALMLDRMKLMLEHGVF